MGASEGGAALVLDPGEGLTKAGFAGQDAPPVVFASCVGRQKLERAMPGGVLDSIDSAAIVGEAAAAPPARALLRLAYADALDWTPRDQEAVWRHAYARVGAAPREHALLLAADPLASRPSLVGSLQMAFDALQVPAMHVAASPVLALYACGRCSGLVLDVGDAHTSIVPICEGFPLKHAAARLPLGGRAVTHALQRHLKRVGCEALEGRASSSEREIVRAIKEALGHVSPLALSSSGEAAASVGNGEYRLPDGSTLKLSTRDRVDAPELLFDPARVGLECDGVATALYAAIRKVDLDLRPVLFENVLLAGGATMQRGFGARLRDELRALAPKDVKIRVFAPKERLVSTWIGGSILASLASFRKMWVDRREFEDSGESIIFRKGLALY